MLSIEEQLATKRQRLMGVYYTPKIIAQVLADWAIRTPNDKILEPSFGGCGFLEACVDRLSRLSVTQPVSNIFGCDKDKQAFVHLSRIFGLSDINRKFLRGDFLTKQPTDFRISNFDAAIGNPPYISLHAMSKVQQHSAFTAMEQHHVALDKRASLWAYFVLHSLSFLKEGGRCAWVLPRSFLQADYSRYVRETLIHNFSKVQAITMEERLFTSMGAKESTVIVLAEGYGQSSHRILQYHAIDSNALDKLISNISNEKPITNDFGCIASPYTISYFNNIRSHDDCVTLGDCMNVRIGIVTGANDFFIINKSHANKNKLPPFSQRPILAKMHQVTGLELTRKDLNQNKEADLRCLLLDASGKALDHPMVKRYLDSFPKEKKDKNATFKKRCVWHSSDDRHTPDAFFSYMCDQGPRLVLNSAETTSTNTIHRIYFKESLQQSHKKLAAISIMTTFSQLSAELVGRSYGSGVLKLEPNEARRLHLLLPKNIRWQEVQSTYSNINKSLRSGNKKLAIKLADNFILKGIFKNKTSFVSSELNKLLELKRTLRRKPRIE